MKGHAPCGVVTAAAVAGKNAALPGSTGDVAGPIVPAVQAVRSRWGGLLGTAMPAARGMIARSRPPQDAGRGDELRVAAAHQGLADGQVEFFGD